MRAISKNKTLQGVAILCVVTALTHAESSVSELWTKSLAVETDGNYARALEIHERILPEMKPSYLVNLRAGWLYHKTENHLAALKYYEKAAGQSSGALAPMYGALNCYAALDESAKVIKAAKAILVIDELNYTANSKLASTYYAAGKFSLAATYYRKLNRLYPEDLAVASGLAWSKLEQGEARQAMPFFKRILMVSPDYAYAERGLEICTRMNNR